MRSRQTPASAAAKACGSTGPAAPLASTAAVSEVEVSVSTDRQLKVSSTAPRKARSSSSGASSASVRTSAIMVAMSGSIMPTPLATPTISAVPPPVVGSVARATFGWVSVVIIAVATSVGPATKGSPATRSRCVRSRSMG